MGTVVKLVVPVMYTVWRWVYSLRSLHARWAYYQIKLRNSRINAHPPLVPRSTVQIVYFRETTELNRVGMS